MDNLIIHQSRDDRYGKTERKNLTLTAEAVAAVQAYADRHGLHFSVAVETLALMGLGQSLAENLPRLVANLLERTVSRQFNRLARLLSLAAMSAEEANHKADVLLLQTIWREARQAPEDFVDRLLVSTDPNEQPDALARQLRDEVCVAAHETAVARLKKPLGKNGIVWETGVADET
jgi:hypothetical protein